MSLRALPLTLAFLVTPAAWAQPSTAPAAPANPASSLSFYVGQWNESGESRADPAEAFGKLSGRERCDWTWNAEAVADGQTTKLRYTFDLVGKTDRKMTVEFQAPDGTWAQLQKVNYSRKR